MGNTLDIINSIFNFSDQARSIYADDIAKKDIDGKRASIIGTTTNSSGGLTINTVFSKVNNMLLKNIRNYGSLSSYNGAISEMYQGLSTILGDKGAQTNLIYRLGALADAAESIQKNPSQINKLNFINAAKGITDHINALANAANNISSTSDQNIATELTDFNNLADQISKLNNEIYEIQSMPNSPDNARRIKDKIDDRDKLLADISKKAGIAVETGENNMRNIKVSDYYVVVGSKSFPLNFTAALPGQPYNTITYLGQDITANIGVGSIKAYIDLRDTLMPQELAKLDQFSGFFADLTNQALNRGTAQALSTTLTGSIGVPGFNFPLTAASNISGQGTVRIAAVDQNSKGMNGNYVDIDLTTIHSVQDLLDAINNANKGLTASLTPAGQLSISSSVVGSGVGISYNASGNRPQINYGNAFNAANAWEFSHFFGLNNFINTGTRLPGGNNTGFSSVITMNSNFINNSQALPCDSLTTDSNPPLTSVAVPDHDGGAMGDFYTFLNDTRVNFLPAGDFSQQNVTLRDYSSLMVNDLTKQEKGYRVDADKYKDVLKDLGSQQYNESGINPKERLAAMRTINELQSVGAKLFKLYMESRRILMELF